MKRGVKAGAAVAVLSGVAGILFAAAPVQAAGDTGRHKGCAAHWRNTAAWGECVDSPGVDLQFNATCKAGPSYAGMWRRVNGSLDPVDRHECTFKAKEAWNAYGS